MNALTELVLSARPPLLVVGAAVLDQAVERRAAIPRSFPTSCWCRRSDRMTSLRSSGCMSRRTRSKTASPVAARAAGVPLQVHAVASRYGEEQAAAQVEEAAAGIPGPRRYASESQERVAEGIRDRQRIRLVRSAHEPAAPPAVVCPYKGLMFFDVDDAPYFVGGSASLRGSLPSWWTRAPRSRRRVGQWQVVGGPCRPGGCASCRHAARQRAMAHRVDDANPTTS